MISRLEVGFVIGLGNTNPPSSVAIHGFASVDPSISSRDTDAIEFVSVSTDVAAPEKSMGVGDKVGNWNLEINHFVDIPPTRVAANGQQTFMTMKSIDFKIGRSPDATLSSDKKAAYFLALKNAAFSPLSGAGFRPADQVSPEITNNLDTMKAQFIKKIQNISIYGFAQFEAPQEINIEIFLTRQPACTSNNGLMYAFTVSEQGQPGVSTDFGSATVFIAGAGSCATDNDALTLMNETISKSERRLRTKMSSLGQEDADNY
ncbi:hypothetical protein AB4Y42_35050 [Paraburkholderia sp. EG286B]|uniref:hypothetical protein n=1 Tax=Paraburkholderia sp. EG286B TaxID=3237011 RepID=UPI0034D1F6E1